MGLDYIVAHTGIWIDIFVILAIILLAIVVLYFILRRRSLIKKEEELEALLSEKYEREKYKSLDDQMNVTDQSIESAQ